MFTELGELSTEVQLPSLEDVSYAQCLNFVVSKGNGQVDVKQESCGVFIDYVSNFTCCKGSMFEVGEVHLLLLLTDWKLHGG